LKVCLAYSPAPREVKEWILELPDGATALQAIEASSLLQEFPDLRLDALLLGLWGKRCEAGEPLLEGSRLEVYRELRVDPKVARRERFKSQGAKGTGLFAKKRDGAKAGY
jgi:uncharacterized protein